MKTLFKRMFGIQMSITQEQAMFNMQDLKAKHISMLSTFVSFLRGKLTSITAFTAALTLDFLCFIDSITILQK